MPNRHRPFQRLALAFACGAFAAPAHCAATANGSLQRAVDAAVRPVMAKYGIPGMAVAVTIDGQSMFFNYGVASKATGATVSEDTLFELGSISKTLTATLACHAQGQGKLSLDDHPGRYMPALTGSPIDAATLIDLGTYTAGGLPLQFPDQVEDDAQMQAYFRAWKPDAAPGTQRRYSNPSLGLFGHLAALALDTGFSDAMERQLLPALGMTHSYVRVPDSAMPQYAWGYNQAGQPVRAHIGVLGNETYGIKATSADLLRFVQHNIAPDQLAPPFQRALACTHVGYSRVGDMVQGLGWEQYRGPVSLQRLLAGNSDQMIMRANPAVRLLPPQAAPGGTLFDKTGSTGGFGAYALFQREQKIGIVMLANKNYPIPARVTAAYAILRQAEQAIRSN